MQESSQNAFCCDVIHNVEKYEEISFYTVVQLFIFYNLKPPYYWVLTLVSTDPCWEIGQSQPSWRTYRERIADS
jgi:hypothetical protein